MQMNFHVEKCIVLYMTYESFKTEPIETMYINKILEQ